MEINKENLLSVLDEIKKGADLFYQQRINEALAGYEDMLGLMLGVVDFLFAYKEEHPEFDMDSEKIQGMFGEILAAMEEGDYTLMADIITYDFTECVEGIHIQM